MRKYARNIHKIIFLKVFSHVEFFLSGMFFYLLHMSQKINYFVNDKNRREKNVEHKIK